MASLTYDAFNGVSNRVQQKGNVTPIVPHVINENFFPGSYVSPGKGINIDSYIQTRPVNNFVNREYMNPPVRNKKYQ